MVRKFLKHFSRFLTMNEMIRSDSDVVFVGDARNVVACWFICQQMCRLLKAVRLNWRRQQGA
ncbi:TPA: hypothetical protein G9F27_005827, partial [Salmonella enterica]|nr:hypothetical protein [Salmonella enterica]